MQPRLGSVWNHPWNQTKGNSKLIAHRLPPLALMRLAMSSNMRGGIACRSMNGDELSGSGASNVPTAAGLCITRVFSTR